MLTFFVGIPLAKTQSVLDSFLVSPYLQWGTQTSMTILWETTDSATTTVEYGVALPNAAGPNYASSVSIEGSRLLHEVTLPDLVPATKYVYRVRSMQNDGQLLVSPVSTFKTNVRDEDAIFFVFVGDSQYNRQTPWAWATIAERIFEERPNFIVHAGDLVDQGTKKTDWTEHFFPGGEKAMRRYPMYTVLGNHEQDAQLYYDYMVNPEPEYYYTFRYGPVQFFMIDTNRDITEGSEQYEWLEWALAKSSAPWKMVVHHHPPYSSESDDHGNTFIGASTFKTHARDLTPLYDAYGVDFCLFGHTHVYERTWPLLNNRISMENGVIYINSGGAGGGLEDFDPVRSWFTKELQTGHHYTTFAVFDKHLSFKALDHEGKLFDSFQLTKGTDNETTGMIRQPPPPRFSYDNHIFQDQTMVTLEALWPEHRLYFTTDGTEPSLHSKQYTGPITIDQTCTLRTRAYTQEGWASRVAERVFEKMSPLASVQTIPQASGLRFSYFEGDWKQLPNFSELTPKAEGVISLVNQHIAGKRANQYGLLLTGYLYVPATDVYTLYVHSDDGSKVFVGEHLIINNDGSHSAQTREGSLILEKGYHPLRIEYMQGHGLEVLQAGFVDSVMGRVPFSPAVLRH